MRHTIGTSALGVSSVSTTPISYPFCSASFVACSALAVALSAFRFPPSASLGLQLAPGQLLVLHLLRASAFPGPWLAFRSLPRPSQRSCELAPQQAISSSQQPSLVWILSKFVQPTPVSSFHHLADYSSG